MDECKDVGMSFRELVTKVIEEMCKIIGGE